MLVFLSPLMVLKMICSAPPKGLNLFLMMAICIFNQVFFVHYRAITLNPPYFKQIRLILALC